MQIPLEISQCHIDFPVIEAWLFTLLTPRIDNENRNKGKPATELPANIQEFNTAVGLLLARLYVDHPVITEGLTPRTLASAVGRDWMEVLPSGRTFGAVLDGTLRWLVSEGYVRAYHQSSRWQMIYLGEKGLDALNKVLPNQDETIGSGLVRISREEARQDWSKYGELAGGFVTGMMKAFGSS